MLTGGSGEEKARRAAFDLILAASRSHFGGIMARSRAGEAFAAYNEGRPIQLNFEDIVSGLSAYPKM
jgi:hypothetical protein